MKKFYVYKIYCTPFNPELISGVVWDFEINGLLEDEDYISIFASEDLPGIEQQLTEELKKLQNDNLIKSFKIEKELLEDKNWNELWEKSREVIRVSDRIIIKPSFKEYTPQKNEIVLTIDPKMSFGTGEHQTTKLMLRALEKFVKPGMKVLDVGAGTGILSIAAIKLCASKAVAVDFDEVCLENCRENCIINEVDSSIEILTGEITDVNEKEFDLVIANIQKNVLIEIADQIKQRIKKNGIVILSGLLESDKTVIEKKYHSLGFKTLQVEQMDEWIAVVFRE